MCQTKDMNTIQYQSKLFQKLCEKFSKVENEWTAFKNKTANQYTPRVDIAVGPFNDIDDEIKSADRMLEYNKLVRSSLVKSFLQKAYNYHTINLDLSMYTSVAPASFAEVIEYNRNPRCLIAIEIENKNTRKHIMGSIVNAASLGKIGIGVGFSSESTKTFLRIVNYLSRLKAVGKNAYDTANFLVLTREQMDELVL